LRHLVDVGTALIRTNAQRGPQNTTGRRLHRSQHWVYGRTRALCPVCPAVLTSAGEESTTWQRITFWCPSCQPTVEQRIVDVARSRRLIALHPAIRLLDRTTADSPPLTA
jgi:endonuclease-8